LGPEEYHNPETKASLTAIMGGRPEIPAGTRAKMVRFIEDLTVSHEAGWYSVCSPHSGGSPDAMKREIWRNYPVMEKTELVEGLLDCGILES
jgi:4-hydroxybutyryl-CoA dehydratase / vinylacetyl-CoA-Delta-isomerase